MGAIVNNTSMRMQYVIAACLYIGQFGIGYNLGWTAPVLAKLKDPEQTPLNDVITDGMSSWIVSFIYFGTISGPYISGYLCNVIGRKPCLFLGGCAHFTASLTLALSKNVAVILTGRVLSGLGNGIIYVTNLMYLGEMASTKIRGTLLTLTGLSSTFGTLVVYSVGPFVSYATISWLSMTISGVYLVALFFIVPETATYHVIAGKKEAAIANLTLLGRQNDIEEVVTKASQKPRSKRDQMAEMFTVKSNRRALFIVLTLSVLQQMSGVIPLTAFVTIIFAMTGSTLEAHVSTIIVGLTQIFAASIAPLLVDRIGRKILLLVSTAACSLSMASLGTYFYLYNNGYAIAEDLQWLSLVSLMLFFVFYFSGFGIIPNTFIGEMFTDTCRGFCSTFSATVGWIIGFGVTTSFGYILLAWGPSTTFYVFTATCTIAFLFSATFVPETKGKSLLQIQEFLGK
uniref:SFRICE_008901 n=1 Tax=Spodoptera frugiperda TaxID=7108 RepID=A0A2H1WAF6_SPOFR